MRGSPTRCISAHGDRTTLNTRRDDHSEGEGRRQPQSVGGLSRREFGGLVIGLTATPCLLSRAAAEGVAGHGIAMHGTPALPAGFTHLPYVNPSAPKGGRVVLGQIGNFDSLTPFIVRGSPAANLRELVYEGLLARSLDEPFSLYGLIARGIEVPADRRHVVFHLDSRARFSDGRPVTAADVIFSWEILREKGLPFMRAHYRTAVRATQPTPTSVRFDFDDSGNREAPLLLGLMPVLPRHRTDPAAFDQTSLEPPVGSGPYRVYSAEAGRSVTYRRNEGWWGRNLPVNRGRFNLDEIRIDYFRDVTSMYEAFKSGQVHLRPEDDPARWTEGYRFPAVREGRVRIAELDLGIPAGMSALAFNTRRWPFSDRQVRQALIHLFDFEWINRNFYHGAYTRTESFFERSVLSSAGRPAEPRERALLAPFQDAVKPAIMDGSYRFPRSDGSGHNRTSMATALAILQAAGFELVDGRMRTSDGRHLAFEVLAATRSQERLLLAFAGSVSRLGISARVRQVDSSQYQERLKSFDFDMIQAFWPASLSPGNEQVNRWGSAAATVPRALNYPGVRNPAVDAMIQALLSANGREDFEAAVRALDRVLLSGDYVIPLFHVRKQWIAYWSHLTPPERNSLYGFALDTWWSTNG